MDLPFLVLVLTLVAFGLVMLCSASSAVALYRRQDAFAYVRPQLLYAAMGLVAMWTASRVDYHIYHKLAWPLLALSLVLLTAVLFMPEYNGCKRWLVLPGLGTLQPSEIAKFAVVLVFAHIIALNHDRMDSFAVGVVPFALVLGVVAVLMLLEPHLSGTVLILSIGAVLMFVGGTGLRSMDKEFHGRYDIWGGDVDPRAVAIARDNARKAGVEDVVRFEVADMRNFRRDDTYGQLVTNPPYGERLLERQEAEALYRDFGKMWERLPDTWRTLVLSSHTEFERTFGHQAKKKRKLYNGMIKCDLFMYGNV